MTAGVSSDAAEAYVPTSGQIVRQGTGGRYRLPALPVRLVPVRLVPVRPTAVR